jgi:peptide/nickel transport system ATP-binding protein
VAATATSTEGASDDRRPARGGASVLSVEGLRTEFSTSSGIAIAVDHLSFVLHERETLAIVGESGSGKSVTALSILRLIPRPAGRISKGAVRFGGRDLLSIKAGDLQAVRGGEIAMIFQDPMTSLNPVLTIGRQLTETIVEHRGIGGAAARIHAIEMLEHVQIPEPARQMNQYPHQLSGGMRQRVMIAMALSCRPKILIADEPTTALDVTVQAQILDLMRKLQQDFGTSIILITHDMGVVAEMADRAIVMYAGRKVEEGDVDAVFERPRHPYTRGLLDALPRISASPGMTRGRLTEIPGIVPPLTRLPVGCRFSPRCALTTDRCIAAYPPMEEKAHGHSAACWESHRLSERGLQ